MQNFVDIYIIYIFEEIEKYEIDMALMHYEKYREIFLDIQGEKVDLAKCNAELAASALMESMDYVKIIHSVLII